MKKFAIIILLMIIIAENRENPAVAPYLSGFKSIITNKMMSSVTVNNFGELAPKVAKLNDMLLIHEAQYAVKNTKTKDQVNEFWRRNCRNKELIHSVLTTYAKQVICDTIEPYIAKPIQ